MPGAHGGSVRIGIIAESFPPDVNGVAHSVLRVAEHLLARGHEPLVIAPQAAGPAGDGGQPSDPGYPVRRVPSVPLPGYRTYRLGVGSAAIRRWLVEHRTEVVHLASPFVLGARGMVTARQLRLELHYVLRVISVGKALGCGRRDDFLLLQPHSNH